jgi:hypothetical protein
MIPQINASFFQTLKKKQIKFELKVNCDTIIFISDIFIATGEWEWGGDKLCVKFAIKKSKISSILLCLNGTFQDIYVVFVIHKNCQSTI